MSRSLAGSITQPRATPLVARVVGVSSGMQARDALWGYVFLLPWILGLIVFFLGPIILSFALSFTQYDVISPPVFSGLDNYVKMVNDELVGQALKVTLYYVAGAVPLGLVGSLLLALLLNQRIRGIARLAWRCC